MADGITVAEAVENANVVIAKWIDLQKKTAYQYLNLKV